MAFDKSEYDKTYYKAHITRKPLNFNRDDAADARLLEWLNRQPNATAYIKALIRQDMNRNHDENTNA